MPREFGHIPEAWPALLDRPQLCAYVGLSDQTLARILPVHPVDLGVRDVRWKRIDIDQRIGGLPPVCPPARTRRNLAKAHRPMESIQRRSSGATKRWRGLGRVLGRRRTVEKSGTSNASGSLTARFISTSAGAITAKARSAPPTARRSSATRSTQS